MKKIIGLLFVLILLCGCEGEGNINYIDRELPGEIPELFAEGIISQEDTSEFAGTFSDDFQYYFFTRREGGVQNRLYYTKWEDGEWSEPVLSPISEDLPEFEPFISPKNELYFGSMRDGNTSLVIYKSEYSDGAWTEPKFVDNGLNDGFAMYISISDKGNIYFTSEKGISVMKYDGQQYSAPEFTGILGAHSFIARDESFLLFDNSSYTTDPTKLFISFMKNDGSFDEPVELSERINDPNLSQICASISPDGKYLFFSRFSQGMADIFWVDAMILNQVETGFSE